MIQNKNKIFLLLFIFFSTSAFCQLDQLKWQKADLTYQKQSHHRQREYSFESENAGEFVKKSLANAYWYFISDVDGDNCPFSPSCSSFLMESISETNLFQGSLMFFDRFTRDINLAKGRNHYPKVQSGHFYDPPQNYTLNNSKINYQPPSFIKED